jgi:hypothetical protein
LESHLCNPSALDRSQVGSANASRIRTYIRFSGDLVTVTDESVRATVRGSGRYRVDLTVAADGELGWSFSCPVGADGEFCKHCVAVALVTLRGGTSTEDGAPAIDVARYP